MIPVLVDRAVEAATVEQVLAAARGGLSGVLVLQHRAGSLREKREAKKAAERVHGVIAVHDELEVRILDKDRRDDTELRGDVLHALILDGLIPTTVDARVIAGLVILTGTASWQYQRDEAEFVAANGSGGADAEVIRGGWHRGPP
jgi:osmotically-inducible protein OsmY